MHPTSQNPRTGNDHYVSLSPTSVACRNPNETIPHRWLFRMQIVSAAIGIEYTSNKQSSQGQI